jgi:hypothetical protein
MKDPKVTVLDLIENNWNALNTSYGQDPDFHTGWHNPQSTDPEVVVSRAEENPTAGGTGFSAIDPTGAGPVQEIDGIVSIEAFSDREVSDVNPKTLTFEFTEEVKSIVKNHALTATDLRYLSYNGRRELPPENSSEPIPTFHYTMRAWYQYEERP